MNAQTSPWYHLGRLSMAMALTVKQKDPTIGREALEEYMASQAISEEHRERLRRELKR